MKNTWSRNREVVGFTKLQEDVVALVVESNGISCNDITLILEYGKKVIDKQAPPSKRASTAILLGRLVDMSLIRREKIAAGESRWTYHIYRATPYGKDALESWRNFKAQVSELKNKHGVL